MIREAKGREKRICIHVDFDNYDGILKKVGGFGLFKVSYFLLSGSAVVGLTFLNG